MLTLQKENNTVHLKNVAYTQPNNSRFCCITFEDVNRIQLWHGQEPNHHPRLLPPHLHLHPPHHRLFWTSLQFPLCGIGQYPTK